MSDAIRLLDIRDGALSSDEVLAAVADPTAGGTALFIGTVRNHDQDKPVDRLSYEAHPDALEHLRKVAQRVCDDPAVTALAAVHRTGDLVSLRSDGLLVRHGRIDRQLNLGGVEARSASVAAGRTGHRWPVTQNRLPPVSATTAESTPSG